MKEIKVTIEGKTPLLLNAFSDEAQQAATYGTRRVRLTVRLARISTSTAGPGG